MTSNVPRKIARQYIHTAIFSGLKVLSALLLLVILGKNLSPQQYGVYALIASTVTLGVYILGLDLYTYLLRWIPGSPAAIRQQSFKILFLFEIALAGILILILIFFSLDKALAEWLNIADSWPLYRAGLLILLFTFGMREMIRYLFAWKRIEIGNKLEFLGANLCAVVLGVFWLGGLKITLSMVMWVWGGALLIALGYGLMNIELGALLKAPLNRNLLKSALLFSLPLYVATLSTQINNYADRFLLSVLHSSTETGLYALVYNMVAIGVLAWGTLFGNVMTPYATEYHNRQMAEQRNFIINMMLKYSYLTTIPLTLFILGIRRELLQLLAKPEYLASEPIIPVLLIVPIIMILTVPLSLIIFLQTRTKRLAIIGIIGAGLNIGLNILVIPHFGALGAAWTSVVAFTVVLLLSYLTVWRAGIINFAASKMGELFIINVFLYLCMYYAVYILSSVDFLVTLQPVGRIILLGGLLSLLYLVLLLFFKVVSLEEVQQLRGFFFDQMS